MGKAVASIKISAALNGFSGVSTGNWFARLLS